MQQTTRIPKVNFVSYLNLSHLLLLRVAVELGYLPFTIYFVDGILLIFILTMKNTLDRLTILNTFYSYIKTVPKNTKNLNVFVFIRKDLQIRKK